MKKSIRTRILSVLFAAALVTGQAAVVPVHALAAGTTYYVDAVSGSDSNAGTSTSTAWKTLSKVNAKTFAAGDKLLFKAGCTWQGELAPMGSGSSAGAITIDMYGTGNKPVIDGNGGSNTVHLTNQSWWEISNLDITNNATTAGDRRGVYITAGSNTVSHIYLRNLSIHGIKGNNASKGTGGIFIGGNNNAASRFDDVRIENNTIASLDRLGMNICENTSTSSLSTNVAVRNNTFSDLGGDGLIINMCSAPVIEYNVCANANQRSGTYACGLWPWNCNNAVFQYNECYGTKTATNGDDGTAWDADAICSGTTYQYNYSHNNQGGSVLICGASATVRSAGAVIRYNISQNDTGRIVYFCGPNLNTSIYNNTFYIGSGVSNARIYSIENNGGINDGNYSYNNIFYNLSSTSSYVLGTSTNNVFDYNVFYGNHPSSEPADSHKLTSDPRLVNPGAAGNGRSTTGGYALQQNSPCIDSGRTISGNGGKDYAGTPVPQAAATDRGAYEYVSTTLQNTGFESGSSGWANWGNTSVVTGNAHGGTYALKAGVASGTANAGCGQTITGAYPGSSYYFSAWGKVSAAGAKGYMGVDCLDSSGKVIQKVELTWTETSYTQKSQLFTAPAGTTAFQVYVYKTGSEGTGYLYADDLSLQ